MALDAVRYDEPAEAGTTVDVATRVVDNKHVQIVAPGVDAEVPGLTPHFNSDGDNSVQQIKASAGRLYALFVANLNPQTCWLQLYDASSPTVGTTAPILSIPVPPGDGVSIYGQAAPELGGPVAFATAIKYACTTTPAGSGDPTAGLIVNALYK